MTETDNATLAQSSYIDGHDVQGSVSQLIDDTAKAKASYGYNAYGGSDAPSSAPQALTTGDTNNLAPVNPHRYSNRRMDSSTASSGTTASPVPNGSAGYDMGARRFGADTGTFIEQGMYVGALGDLGLSLDPLTQNPYCLAGGNPISFMETDGHMVIADGGGGSTTSSPPPTPPAVRGRGRGRTCSTADSTSWETPRSGARSGSGTPSTSARGSGTAARRSPCTAGTPPSVA
jgi:hypothetical protein